MRVRRRSALVCAIAVVAGFSPAAHGQAPSPPCVLDRCLGSPGASLPSAPPPPPGPSDGTAHRAPLSPGAFDFYVLALSWSPAFCENGGVETSPDQCAAGHHRGFVVHGLWPQNQRGYPSECDQGSRFLSQATLDQVSDLYPDPGLARHEWRTHGTCSGLAPRAYFATVRQARAAVAIPPALQAPDEPQTLDPLAIARAFAAANPGLRSDAMAVTCRHGELDEVRVCLSKDLRRYVPCPEVTREACRTRAIAVLPGR